MKRLRLAMKGRLLPIGLGMLIMALGILLWHLLPPLNGSPFGVAPGSQIDAHAMALLAIAMGILISTVGACAELKDERKHGD